VFDLLGASSRPASRLWWRFVISVAVNLTGVGKRLPELFAADPHRDSMVARLEVDFVFCGQGAIHTVSSP